MVELKVTIYKKDFELMTGNTVKIEAIARVLTEAAKSEQVDKEDIIELVGIMGMLSVETSNQIFEILYEN